jgi:glutathione S-transferase
MSTLTLVVGSKNYSSWSLRGYLALAATGQPFEEKLVLLDRPDTAVNIAAFSPSGRVPALLDGDRVIWDSLAIGEYLHERFPAAGLWPADPAARALARSVTAEMHSGFAALRTHMPMNLRARRPGVGHGADGVEKDIQRITAIWRECRARFGDGGPFLFGAFCLADAFYAPVATRFLTYGVELDPVCAAYRDAVLALPAMKAWTEAAAGEPAAPKYD